MNNLTPHQPQPTGAIVVVHAFLARLLAMPRSVGSRNELQRQLRGLFGAHLVHDPVVMGETRAQRLAFLRCTGRTVQARRAQRIQLHLSRTLLGRGFNKHSKIMIAIRFAHGVARRPMQQVSCARLRFVATRHERLAGAPPSHVLRTNFFAREPHDSGVGGACLAAQSWRQPATSSRCVEPRIRRLADGSVLP